MTMASIGAAMILAAPAPPAQAGSAGKDQYTLFNPTPRELWRELSADRPDFTESPFTVDAGAVQLEMSFVEWSRNGDEETLTAAPVNLKLGLTNRIDLQLVWDGWQRQRNDDATVRGAGDLSLRLKLNLWGNDPRPGTGDTTALGLMPFIKLPTASDEIGNGKVEGGLIAPLAIDLADGLALGLMLETDAVYDEEHDEYDLDVVHTAVLGIDLTDRLGAYVEYVGIAGDQPYRALLGLGGTLALTANLVLDAGINVGLLGDTDDVQLFTGMTIRF